MINLLSEYMPAITWGNVLIGVLIFIASFLINLGIVSLILVKLPANHFSKNRKTKFWAGPRPALHAAKVIGKNLLGVVLVALGVVLSLPGVPGQGLLTILLGLMLLDFPGRERLEQKLLSKPSIVNTINRLRGRFGKPPLVLN
nr:sodium:dicarboxylate symporter family [uncultured bacterium]